MGEPPSKICMKDLSGEQVCWTKEEITELYFKVLNDLELLGIVDVSRGRIIIRAERLALILEPCFKLAREIAKSRGTYEALRDIANRNIWDAACFALSYCVLAELSRKVADYGLQEQSPARDPIGYPLVLSTFLQIMLESASKKEEAIELFKRYFDLQNKG